MPRMWSMFSGADLRSIKLGDSHRCGNLTDCDRAQSWLDFLKVDVLRGPRRFRLGAPKPFCLFVPPLRIRLLLEGFRAVTDNSSKFSHRDNVLPRYFASPLGATTSSFGSDPTTRTNVVGTRGGRDGRHVFVSAALRASP